MHFCEFFQTQPKTHYLSVLRGWSVGCRSPAESLYPCIEPRSGSFSAFWISTKPSGASWSFDNASSLCLFHLFLCGSSCWLCMPRFAKNCDSETDPDGNAEPEHALRKMAALAASSFAHRRCGRGRCDNGCELLLLSLLYLKWLWLTVFWVVDSIESVSSVWDRKSSNSGEFDNWAADGQSFPS